jgi:plasmid replication initiation protein
MLPQRYPEADLFVCDILDAAPKGDMGSMEHPLFSLSTKPDMKVREYKNGNSWLTIQPSASGLATVHDRDVLIYCISQCMAALNSGTKVSRKLSLNAYDLLRATNRQDSGAGNDLLKDALRRLAGTRVETNIHQGGEVHTSNFGLIDGFDVISKTDNGRIQQLQVTLSDWVFDAIENNHVLTLNRGYFQLRKPIERRLYELARKHCGHQPRWEINLSKLKVKAGSASTDKEFKRMLSKVIKDNIAHSHMPDYSFELIEDKLIVRPIRTAALTGHLAPLKPASYDDARTHAPGWDVHVLEAEWRSWVTGKGIKVRNVDTNFISFCKKRGPYKQEELF